MADTLTYNIRLFPDEPKRSFGLHGVTDKAVADLDIIFAWLATTFGPYVLESWLYEAATDGGGGRVCPILCVSRV